MRQLGTEHAGYPMPSSALAVMPNSKNWGYIASLPIRQSLDSLSHQQLVLPVDCQDTLIRHS